MVIGQPDPRSLQKGPELDFSTLRPDDDLLTINRNVKVQDRRSLFTESASLSEGDRRLPQLDEARLDGVQLQTEPREPLAQLGQEATRENEAPRWPTGAVGPHVDRSGKNVQMTLHVDFT